MEKWALITGASSGFGVDYANIIAQEGLILFLTARRLKCLESLIEDQKIRHLGRVHCISSDLSLQNSAKDLYLKTKELGVIF